MIDINMQCDRWHDEKLDEADLIENTVRATLLAAQETVSLSDKETELSVVLCDDLYIQSLNKQYRNKDKVTNVLSFPQTEFPLKEDAGDFVILGDVILAYETIKKEAEEQNKTFTDHVRHLVTHGTLHLLGYDHEEPQEAEIMENLEIKILSQFGVENPYSKMDFVS